MRRLIRFCALAALLLPATAAFAAFHMYRIEQLYSNADGTVQFIVLHEVGGFNGENLWMDHTLRSGANVYTFPRNLPGGTGDGYGMTLSPTANTRVLVATQGFAALGIVTPDFTVPNGFLSTGGGTVNYADVDQVTYASLPTDGTHSINRNGATIQAMATNFAGDSAAVTGTAAPSGPIAAFFENPQTGSFQSGLGIMFGWSCQGPNISIVVDGGAPIHVPYGSTRPDTSTVCGNDNTLTGFGILYNYNKLGNGMHSAQLFVNGQRIGEPTQFTVTPPAGEYLSGASKEVTVTDFPSAGKTTTLIWQQWQQNFAIKAVTP